MLLITGKKINLEKKMKKFRRNAKNITIVLRLADPVPSSPAQQSPNRSDL